MHDVVVVGAGPAGLATAGELTRRGIPALVLERGPRLGHTWEHFYDSLVLHTGKHRSVLPRMAFPPSTPLFPPRRDFVEYLHRYRATFGLRVETGRAITRAERDRAGWVVHTAEGAEHARVLVVATGIVSNPQAPAFPARERFRGQVIHSVAYRRPDPFRDGRVLVVGVGNSGGEIAAELARAGARVTVAVRSGALAVPRELLGIPIQYYSCVTARLPRWAQRMIVGVVSRVAELRQGPPVLPRPVPSPCPDVPLIGFHLPDAIRQGRVQVRGAVREFTEDGVRFADGAAEPFDHVILATGYRAAIGFLDGLVHVDECGFAARRGRMTSADCPDLFFVGHNYDGRGGLYNIAMDARLAAKAIAGRR